MSRDPRVTVLIVTYNHAEYIEQCLRSVWEQSLPTTILAIDDASPDNTGGKLRELAQSGDSPTEVVVNSENIGLCATLAKAFDQVSTEYVAYISGDDWMEPERIAKQVAALDEAGPAAALCYSDAFRANAAGEQLPELFSQTFHEIWPTDLDDPFPALLRDNWIPAPTVMLRTESLRNEGGIDARLAYEDHDIYLRLARRNRLICLDEPLATHRELSTGLGRIFFHEAFRDTWLDTRVKIYLKHLGFRQDCDVLIAQLLTDWVWQLYLSGSYSSSDARHTLKDVVPFVPASTDAHRLMRLTRLGISGRIVGKYLGGTRRLTDLIFDA